MLKPLRNTRFLVETTDVGPVTGRGIPRMKLKGKPCQLFFGRDPHTGTTYVLDSYDVAHAVDGGVLVPDGALLAIVDATDADPAPLRDVLITTRIAAPSGGIIRPDGAVSDDVQDSTARVHEERIVACGPDVPRSDGTAGQLAGNLIFGSGPDTPELYWAGRTLRFVPWARALALRPPAE